MKTFWKWLRDLNSDLVWQIYNEMREKGPDLAVWKILAHRVIFFVLKFEPDDIPTNLGEVEIPF